MSNQTEQYLQAAQQLSLDMKVRRAKDLKVIDCKF